jgi:hypothetical protein
MIVKTQKVKLYNKAVFICFLFNAIIRYIICKINVKSCRTGCISTKIITERST